MATLSNGTLIVSGETDATIEITTDDDSGILYAAAKKDVAWVEGDGDDIINGVGSDWTANKVPTIGVNTFNLTGLDDDQAYHCGFVQDSPPSGALFEHDFNAAIGGFTYERTGDAWGFQHDGYIRKVADNATAKPVYFKCAHDGTDFTPHADYQGLVLTSGSTNTLVRNGGNDGDIRDYWNYNGVTISADFSIGEVWMTPITGDSASAAPLERSYDGASYAGPWTWTCFVAEGTSTGFSVEINNDRGTANYAWVGGVPVLQNTVDGARSWSYHCGGGLWAIALVIPTVTNQWKVLRFYPSRKDAWVNSTITYFFAGTLVDQGYPGSDPSPFVGAELSVTTAASFAHQTFADMGLSEASQNFTVFLRMQLFFDDTVDAPGPYVFTVGQKNTTDEQDRLTLRIDGAQTYNYLSLEKRVGAGSVTSETFAGASLDTGTVYNIFISYDSAGDIIMRVDNNSSVKAGAGLVLDNPRGHLILGRRHLTDTTAEPGPMAIRNVKVWDYALTDSEMDDIDNAYP